MLTSIAGKNVVVTGGSKGIGKGIAQVFAKHGANVLVVSRNQQQADAAALEMGKNAKGFACDISNWSDCEAMAQAAASHFGGIDILCANAGIFPQTSIESMSIEEWNEVLATNLGGNFMCIKACLPFLKQSEQGRVVLTSSITGPMTGFRGGVTTGRVRRVKSAFYAPPVSSSLSTASPSTPFLPGNVMTEGLDGLGEDYLNTMAASIPLRKLGSVEDIGNAALFLSSKEASYITGQTIVVDGGQTQPETLEALDA